LAEKGVRKEKEGGDYHPPYLGGRGTRTSAQIALDREKEVRKRKRGRHETLLFLQALAKREKWSPGK